MNARKAYYFLAKSLSDSFPSDSSEFEAEVKKNAIDWKLFTSIASNHYLLQAIYPIYKKKKLLVYLPVELTEHLGNIHILNSGRNREILKQISSLSSLLRENNIRHLFLKGSALLLNRIYEEEGSRIMEDIDVLVNEEDYGNTIHLLLDNGYTGRSVFDAESIEHKKHYPRIHKPGEPAEVEIHKMAVGKRYNRKFSNSLLFSRAVPSKVNAEILTPSTEYLLLHCILHTQLEHRAYRTAHFRLRDVLDVYSLSKKTDTGRLLKEYKHFRGQIRSFLALASRLLRTPITDIPAGISVKCYIFHHTLNIRFRFILLITLFFTRVPKKIFTHYIKVPVLALFNTRIRKHFFSVILSKKAWKRHLGSYRSILK